MVRSLFLAAAALALAPSAASAQVAYASGLDGYGQLGNGGISVSYVPVAVSTAGVLSGQTVTAVAGGGVHGRRAQRQDGHGRRRRRRP